jgi:hypothetical protein
MATTANGGTGLCYLTKEFQMWLGIGHRRSDLPSRRTDRQVRLQSAIAAIVLIAIALSAIWLLARL